MFIRRINGRSMFPTLRHGQLVIGWHRRPRAGDVVLARQSGREVVKRVEAIKDQAVYLVGDNRTESHDSRHYGHVRFQDIIGSIMITLPTSSNPPKLVKPYGAWVGRAAAALLAAMALTHLFRIDTLIPIVDEALPGGAGWATVITVLIILSEVFAIPFLLRMKLSLLAQFVSATLAVLAPFLWLLVGIWAYGLGVSTGELGEFVATPSTDALMILNLVWLALNYYALWLLGYNKLPLKKLVAKSKK
jgi:hypothetical protein